MERFTLLLEQLPPRTRPPPQHWTGCNQTNDREREGRNLRSLLVLLVLSDQILHVRLRFGELHLVHTLLGVPMQEGLPLEHRCELITDALEELLNSGRVTEEGDGHLHSSWSNVTLSSKNIVGNPLDEVGTVLHLNVLHLFLDLLHRNLATEDGSNLQAQ